MGMCLGNKAHPLFVFFKKNTQKCIVSNFFYTFAAGIEYITYS